MFLKFKRFWTFFTLIFCLFGLIAPVNMRAQGEDIPLETLAKWGGTAAAATGFIGLLFFANAMRWLGVKIAQAKEQENKQKVSRMTIDEWCIKNGYKLAPDITSNPEEIKNKIKEALDSGNAFQAAQQNVDRYEIHDFVDTLETEIEEIEAVMSKAETYSFVSGLSENNRFAVLGGLEVDWRQNNWKGICAAAVGTQPSSATQQTILHRQPHEWSRLDYAHMDKEILGDITNHDQNRPLGYVEKMWRINKITKLAVEAWWIYFKKLYRHQALYEIANKMSGMNKAARKARIKELQERRENRKADSAQYVFAGHSQDDVIAPRPAQPAPQPQVAQQQRWTWKSAIFNKWTAGLTALSTLAGASYWYWLSR